MKKNSSKSFPIAMLIMFAIFIFSCNNKNEKASEQITNTETAVDLNAVSVSLPAGKGLELVQANCVPCHSLRYIEMQPNLPRKAWEKTVTKMVKTFSAPIDSITSAAIVDYLVAVKGKK